MLTIILIIVFILLILNPSISSITILEASSIWFNKLVPILFPSLIIIDLLNNDKRLEALSLYLVPLFKRIFKIRYPKSSFIIILSIICGAPGSYKLIANSLDNNEIDITEANSLSMAFSGFSLAYTIFILNSFNISIIFYYIIFILLAIFIMKYNNRGIIVSEYKKSIKRPILKELLDSINKNTNILISILGIIIIFKLLIVLTNVNEVLYLFIEPLGGHNKFSSFIMKKKLKDGFITSSLSFLGLSIHLQIYYRYDKLNYKKFLFFRFISSCIYFLFFFIK